MPDPELRSVHLEAAPRREQFRLARDLVRAACGEQTLVGAPALSPRGGSEHAAPARPPTEYYLRDDEHLHPLSVGINSVGRLPGNDVVIRDEHVSRRHCAIVIHRDGRAEVHDIASKNGTILNGKKIACPTRLHSGDQITMCARSVVFLAGRPDDAD